MNMRFNVNEYVKVRLTDRGREILRQRRTALGLDALEIREDDGWSQWQLWELMSIFGPHIYLGTYPLPFETDIEIVTLTPV